MLIKTKLNKKKRFDLIDIFRKLFSLGIRNLLIEGGNEITRNILINKLANQFYLFKSRKNLSKSKKYIDFTSNNILKRKYYIESKISNKLAKDDITIYKR